jgi:hypothetical protein
VKVKPHEIETPKTFRRAFASAPVLAGVGFTVGARRASNNSIMTLIILLAIPCVLLFVIVAILPPQYRD